MVKPEEDFEFDFEINPEDEKEYRVEAQLNAKDIESKAQIANLQKKLQEIGNSQKLFDYIKCFTTSWVVCLWLLLLLVVIAKWACNKTVLDSSVLITLLSTTTANILGLMFVITRYYFSHNNKSSRKK